VCDVSDEPKTASGCSGVTDTSICRSGILTFEAEFSAVMVS